MSYISLLNQNQFTGDINATSITMNGDLDMNNNNILKTDTLTTNNITLTGSDLNTRLNNDETEIATLQIKTEYQATYTEHPTYQVTEFDDTVRAQYFSWVLYNPPSISKLSVSYSDMFYLLTLSGILQYDGTKLTIQNPIPLYVHDIFMNGVDLDVRINTIEIKTQNQTAIPNSTTFTGLLSCDTLDVGTLTGYIKGTTGSFSAVTSIPESDVTNLTTDLSSKVPYTGATTNVDLNSKNLTNVNSFVASTVTTPIINGSTGINIKYNGTDILDIVSDGISFPNPTVNKIYVNSGSQLQIGMNSSNTYFYSDVNLNSHQLLGCLFGAINTISTNYIDYNVPPTPITIGGLATSIKFASPIDLNSQVITNGSTASFTGLSCTSLHVDSLNGYIKGTTGSFSAVSSIPESDITGLSTDLTNLQNKTQYQSATGNVTTFTGSLSCPTYTSTGNVTIGATGSNTITLSTAGTSIISNTQLNMGGNGIYNCNILSGYTGAGLSLNGNGSNIQVSNTVVPDTTNTKSLGTNSLVWNKVCCATLSCGFSGLTIDGNGASIVFNNSVYPNANNTLSLGLNGYAWSNTYSNIVTAPTINNNAGVAIQYNGSTKLATNNTGITVTGSIYCSNYTSSGGITVGVTGANTITLSTAGTSIISNTQINMSDQGIYNCGTLTGSTSSGLLIDGNTQNIYLNSNTVPYTNNTFSLGNTSNMYSSIYCKQDIVSFESNTFPVLGLTLNIDNQLSFPVTNSSLSTASFSVNTSTSQFQYTGPNRMFQFSVMASVNAPAANVTYIFRLRNSTQSVDLLTRAQFPTNGVIYGLTTISGIIKLFTNDILYLMIRPSVTGNYTFYNIHVSGFGLLN